MNKNIKHVLFNSIISMLIGVFVGFINILLPIFTGNMIAILISHSVTGLIIGNLIFLSSYYLQSKVNNNKIVLFSVASVILIIIPSVCISIESKLGYTEISLPMSIVLILVIEVLGLSFTYISYKKSIEMNVQLDKKKKNIVYCTHRQRHFES